MRLTFISDTHTRHRLCEGDLPGGDLLIHAGDFMNSGYHKEEAMEFVMWFNSIKGYDKKYSLPAITTACFRLMRSISWN